MMTKTEAIQAIQDHINACRPVPLNSVVNYCLHQGLNIAYIQQAVDTLEETVDYEQDDDSGDIVLC